MDFKVQGKELVFTEPLLEATIVDRPNRFIINAVLADGTPVKCHCPVTGVIGGLKMNGLQCLLSVAPSGGKRTTTHTVEAIAVASRNDDDFQWIGINQNMVNRYIESFIDLGSLSSIPLLKTVNSLKREPRLGGSRLDFLVNSNVYVEVKTPIKNLQVRMPSTVNHVEPAATGTERMLRQVRDMMAAMGAGDSALLLTVFMYDNPGFKIPVAHNDIYAETVKTMTDAAAAGLVRRQVNLKMDEVGVKLQKVV